MNKEIDYPPGVSAKVSQARQNLQTAWDNLNQIDTEEGHFIFEVARSQATIETTIDVLTRLERRIAT